MKIAIIVGQFPALSETFILNQITGLLDRGHEVDIFARRPGIYPKTHIDVERYNLLKNTSYFNNPVNKFYLFKCIKFIIKNFRKKPKTLLKSINVFKFGKKAATLNILWSAIPFLDKGPYDIVHCHFGPYGILGMILKDIGAVDGKLVVTFHGQDVTSYPKKCGQNVYKNLFCKADVITVNSNFTRNKVVALGCNEDKIVKQPVGLKISDFPFKEKSLSAEEEIRILTVGRLVEKKGIEYSVKAVAKALENHQNIIYHIVGDGPLRNQLLELIEELHVENNIKLLGWKNQDEIRQLYSETHIFILSSVTAYDGDQEGQGLVLQEAQAMGIPVIATLHNGFPESILDGNSGFLVPEKDIDTLTERLEYLIEHPEVWPKMREAGRKFVEEHFDINKLNVRLEEIYKRLLAPNFSK